MTENEFLLEDRLGVIRDTITKYGEENFYLSFSGGKDSTVVHYLLDMALPDNKISRVFVDTGIEYNLIRQFVKELSEQDERFIMIKPSHNIRTTLETVGYPFKSKVFSNNVALYQRLGKTKGVRAFLGEEPTKKGVEKHGQFRCPDKLRYCFTQDFKLKVSDRCCWEMKKTPIKNWEQQTNRTIGITGILAEEGGARLGLNCIITNPDGSLHRFHPLVKVSKKWEDWFIERYNVILCKLYYSPYNFERTGCKGCPFARDLQQCLDAMEPNERKQCEMIWKPVYDEYRRIGYRLNKGEQLKLL